MEKAKQESKEKFNAIGWLSLYDELVEKEPHLTDKERNNILFIEDAVWLSRRAWKS
jgi:hypothetical protein